MPSVEGLYALKHAGLDTHASIAARQSSSPYLRYHWSSSATTHSSPDREMTSDSGSQYAAARPSAIMSARTRGFASKTFLPAYLPTVMTPL